MRVFILVLLCNLLSACAESVSSIKKDIDLPLQQNSGYLLLAVNTDTVLEGIVITGEKTIKLEHDDLKKFNNFILLDMPAGNYKFDAIRLSRFASIQLDNDYWGFAVSPGVISYVGELNLRSTGFFSTVFRVQLHNKSSEALQHMEANFPGILEKRRLRYRGPGEDKFFELMEQQGQ